MRKGDVRAEYVINIQKIAGLEYIESEEKRGLIFGATTKLRSIETSKAIQDNSRFGMILMAKTLLDENLSPTPQEVKEGLGGNLCRCTGYVKIIDAVMAAAETMRKER